MVDIQVGKKRKFVANLSDSAGNLHAHADGPLAWSIDPVGGALEVAPDTLSAVFTAGGGEGLVILTAQGAGGGVAVGYQEGINIVPGDVVAITLSHGDQY